jgi:ABC-type polysaccharide/polyol phosphate export permease
MPAEKTSSFRNARDDFLQIVPKCSVWMALGWNDVQGRYNRSKLGVFWASLSILIFVSALGPIYSKLFGVEADRFVLHLMLGLIVWNYMQGIIMESGREYVNAVNYLVSFQLSYSTLLMRVVWRNLVVLAYQFLVFLVMAVVLGLPWDVRWVLLLPALLLITLNALWMGLIMSVLATRFRDLSELMNNILRLVFFVTPIMWLPDIKPELKLVADLNPFFHLIELVRSPLLNATVDINNWLVSLLMLLIGWLVAFPLFAVYRSRIAFWI